MTPTDFSILPEWESSEYGPAELKQTAARITIMVGGETATQSVDTWSKSVSSSARLSAYPLALWLASSWWRLRWEPTSTGGGTPHGWRMSHELAAVGGGFVWPLLCFDSDGVFVETQCRQAARAETESVHYLQSFAKSVRCEVFERAVENFISLVIARLDAMDVVDTDLHAIWHDVQTERRSAKTSLYRRVEACLGFDPDEAPEMVVNEVVALTESAGPSATNEIAAACSGSAPHEMFTKVRELAASSGIAGGMDLPADFRGREASRVDRSAPPWEQGWKCAHGLRNACGLNGGPVDDSSLYSLLSLPQKSHANFPSQSKQAPLGLAVRTKDSGEMRFMFRKRNATGLRFEAARFIGDYLFSSKREMWHPLTDYRTARQKFQRAFAIEFLCPITALLDFMDNDYSESAIEEASGRFNVSSLAIASHLVNNKIIPIAAVPMVSAYT